MMNLGPRPTFGDMNTTLEAHLFDATGDFYDACVRVDFVSFIRTTRKFLGADDLSAQLRKDEEHARFSLTRTA
jgi:riboflavin kinase/FMN adenylyltransferase